MAYATSYLVNPAHTSAVDDATLTWPLKRIWAADLGAQVSYPLIAQGLVYVGVRGATATDSKIVALDAKTGAQMWAAPAQGALSPTYDQGQVFVVAGDGLVQAFDASTGRLLWTSQLATSDSSQPPVAYGGALYVSGSGGSIAALDESDGSIVWAQDQEPSGPMTTVAASDAGEFVAYVSGGSVVARGYDEMGGLLWWYSGPCSSAQLGAPTPSLFDGGVYVRSPCGDLVVDTSSGTTSGTFQGSLPPALHDDWLFAVDHGGTLKAWNLSTGAIVWSSTGRQLTSAPLVVGGEVYASSSTGDLVGWDEVTGSSNWSDDMGAPIISESLGQPSPSFVSLAAGQGVLVAPAGTHVIAYAR